MNILLIGSGGREHALARALNSSASCTSLYAAPGNPGIFQEAKRCEVNVQDFEAVVLFCKSHSIDLVVVGPDQALADGITDALSAHSIAVFGPTKAAARIEWSKSFAKELMQRAEIPTAASRKFRRDEREQAGEYIRSFQHPPVIKADGLALGKGVVVAATHEEAIEALNSMLDGAFQAAGETVIVEEFLNGEEASVFAICDGENYVCLASAQDHKRARDNDEGKNTGGMGTYAPAPVVTPEVQSKVERQVIRRLLQTMKNEGIPFVGCLFVGLMIEGGEPRVVEFNARFGDPEAQSILTVLKGDFARLCYSAAQGKLDPSAIEDVCLESVCTVVLASNGYPDSYEKGFVISGLDEASKLATIYHAGTAMSNSQLVTNGGRVLGITATAPRLHEAIDKAYRAAECVEFTNKYYRRDIGQKGLRALHAMRKTESIS